MLLSDPEMSLDFPLPLDDHGSFGGFRWFPEMSLGFSWISRFSRFSPGAQGGLLLPLLLTTHLELALLTTTTTAAAIRATIPTAATKDEKY